MLPFTQHEMILPRFSRGCTTIERKRITAIPKSTLLGIAVFLRIFFIPFLLQFDFRRICAERFLVSEVFLCCKSNHFSVIFESMSNREIAGIIILDGRYQSDTKTVTT